MTIHRIQRDQGDTAVAITTQLLVGGSPYDLTGASVVAVVGGTVGSGPGAVYARYVLPATWTVASQAMASVTIPLSPSSLAATNPCASAGVYGFEVRAVDSSGLVTQWPPDAPVPFVVRKHL